jgi:hypothetical protein
VLTSRLGKPAVAQGITRKPDEWNQQQSTFDTPGNAFPLPAHRKYIDDTNRVSSTAAEQIGLYSNVDQVPADTSVMQFVAIILLCVVAAVAYGIIHDQITARICVEYFTIGHPPVFGTDDPTLLGLGWGILATWWVGLTLGVLLAMSSRLGAWPKLSASRLVRPLAIMLAIVGVLAVVAGAAGHVAATRRWVWLAEPLASRIPAHRHVAFLTDLWAHLASYIGASLGAVVLCIYVISLRARGPALSST